MGLAVRALRAFTIGVVEFRRAFTARFESDAESAAYDRGRALAHSLTLRRFD